MDFHFSCLNYGEYGKYLCLTHTILVPRRAWGVGTGSSVRRQGGVELAGWKRREGICAEESTLGDLFSTRAET
jgi:hypothetical protein